MEYGVWSVESGVWSLEFGVWSLEFGVWSLEFGVWGVVWSLEFGVWVWGDRMNYSCELLLRTPPVKCGSVSVRCEVAGMKLKVGRTAFTLEYRSDSPNVNAITIV